MIGSPSSVLTMGLGSWGSSSLLVTLGYGTEGGAVVETGTPAPTWRGVGRPGVARGQQRGDVLRGSPRAETMRPRR
jgi:hypothetical protein